MTVELRPGRLDDASAAASLHARRIHEGFLVQLGSHFLRRLYRRIARSHQTVFVVADDDGRVVGFLAAATSTRGLYGEFLRRDAIPAGLAALPTILRQPRRVWETLRYGTADADNLPSAEILSLAVDEDASHQGIGRSLVTAGLQELAARGVEGVQVVTAASNEPAIRAYGAAGFRRHATVEVHPGVVQEVLVWR